LLYKPRTEAEIDQIILKTADIIEKHELWEPAFLFFETIRPVALVGGKITAAGLAFIIPLIGYSIDDYLVAFQEPASIDKIQKILEERRVAMKERQRAAKEVAKAAKSVKPS
jgi:hypothetical protein